MNLTFKLQAVEDLAYWIQHDRRKAEKILKLVQEIAKNPYEGIGKPEPLKYDLSGCWSRRIDQEHRIVYTASADAISILSCRLHY